MRFSRKEHAKKPYKVRKSSKIELSADMDYQEVMFLRRWTIFFGGQWKTNITPTMQSPKYKIQAAIAGIRSEKIGAGVKGSRRGKWVRDSQIYSC